jgi:hypothetical protein
MTTTLTDAVAPRAATRTRRVFVPLALLAILMAAVGFWPGYFGPVLAQMKAKTALVHVHALVFTGWLALFTMQAALAATGRIAVHMRLGRWLFAFGAVLIVVGVLTALGRFANDVAANDMALATRRLFAPLRDMVVFTPLLVAGWIYRRQPEIHKRIMLVATNVLLVAAVGRMQFLGALLGVPPPVWLILLIWTLPVLIAMGHDFVSKRLVHPVYVVGMAAMVAMQLVLPLRTTQPWLDFTVWLAAFYR